MNSLASFWQTFLPYKGCTPEAIHQQGSTAFCDVGTEEEERFPEQVHVDLEDLLLGREGGRMEGRNRPPARLPH